jgi:hypothetical protein
LTFDVAGAHTKEVLKTPVDRHPDSIPAASQTSREAIAACRMPRHAHAVTARVWQLVAAIACVEVIALP